LDSGTLEEVHDVEFDETKGSQDEDENLNDVRGTQLINAMKKMDAGDIRPREVMKLKMTKIKYSLPQMCKLVALMVKIKLVQVVLKCKINNKWLIHHLN
jgi:hypothetical protein